MSRIIRIQTHKAVSLLLAAMIFGLGLASVYPDFHEALHFDSDCQSECEQESQDAPLGHTEHSCAVTWLQAGTTLSFDLDLPSLGLATRTSHQAHQVECVRTTRIALYHSRAPPIEKLA